MYNIDKVAEEGMWRSRRGEDRVVALVSGRGEVASSFEGLDVVSSRQL